MTPFENGHSAEDAIMAEIREASEYIKSCLPDHLRAIQVGVICGSGLQGLASSLSDSVTIDYASVPHFPVGHVSGHKPCLKVGLISGRPCMVFMGRYHGYENLGPVSTSLLVRVMAYLEIPDLIITNSSGSVNVERCRVGDFLVVEDHISFPILAGISPLSGPNLPHFGPRFPAVHQVYHKDSHKLVVRAAESAGIDTSIIKSGVYCHVGGPSYETPSEVKLLKLLGGAAVGMSTAPEVITAAHCSQIKKVIVIALITNEPSSSEEEGPTHEEVLAVAAARALEFKEIVANLVTLV